MIGIALETNEDEEEKLVQSIFEGVIKMAIGDITPVARYNNFNPRVATIMGTGSETMATVNSNCCSECNSKLTDMSPLHRYCKWQSTPQTGVTPTGDSYYFNPDVVLDSDTINKKGVAQFENLTTILENEKVPLHRHSRYSGRSGLFLQYTSNWNGTLAHLIDVTFTDADLEDNFLMLVEKSHSGKYCKKQSHA